MFDFRLHGAKKAADFFATYLQAKQETQHDNHVHRRRKLHLNDVKHMAAMNDKENLANQAASHVLHRPYALGGGDVGPLQQIT